MPEPKIDYLIANLTKLDVYPGDTVVLQTDMHLDKDQINSLRDRFNEQTAHLNVKTIILTHGMKIGVLRKEDALVSG